MKVLVIDDEPGICDVVRRAMTAKNHECLTASNGWEALELVREHRFDLVFCDVLMQGMNGMDVLRQLRGMPAFDGEIVIMTGQASIETAIAAVQNGADDFISKSFNVEQLQEIASAAAQRRSPLDLIDIPRTKPTAHEMRGRSPAIIEVVKDIIRVAPTELPVMITGETGTGKELAARLIHRSSPRAQRPFIALNCGALPDSLLESELFGHVRGAFTGADIPRRGIFEEANGGTIFLDEVSETSLTFQVKLLRVLEEREVTPLGSNVRRPIDVRVLSASNRDPQEMTGAASFRQDLLFRLQGFRIVMPPLRQRREDITAIAMTFLSQFAPEGRAIRITKQALAAIESFDWPGNVRQLKHVCQQVASMAKDVIRVEDLPGAVVRAQPVAKVIKDLVPTDRWPSLQELESNYVSLLRANFNDNKTRIAKVLGVDRKTVARLIERQEMTSLAPLKREGVGDAKSQ